ncbi:hypothetical protein [Acaryochloris marina]|uniref:Uncharacterized protein n=1 Tax=Acaryochloris marina (strain MBIC 11017) TaxID=329726 RepID=A8ZQM9_ACAM1|nr:hypothetical protein [Acaryochloris marina]ABW33315.1 hypothetical protein AM1_G0135 [Acaryochloris marina MBIC11017]
MKSTSERYNSLASSYIKLSDEFHQLDVAHMDLKQKLLPAIKAIKNYQSLTHQLQQDNTKLEQTIQTLTDQQQRLEEDQRTLKAKEVEQSIIINALTDEKTNLQAALEEFQAKYDALADFESLLQSGPQAVLAEAEQQMLLVEETLQEIALNSDPDLSENEQQLIEAYQDEDESLFISTEISKDSSSLKIPNILSFVA